MTNKVLTFLDEVGLDLEHGLVKLLPTAEKVTAVAQAAEPYISQINPLFGSIFQTVVSTAAEIEQKFAALGKQGGTGVQKLAEATTILTPLLSKFLSTTDVATIQKYISAAVGVMNAIPAATAAPAAPAS